MTISPSSTRSALAPSIRLVEGRYELREKIGSGGMGTVFRAYDILLKRSLAIKLLNADKVSDRHIARLHREARAICQLEHRNIIKIYDFLITRDNEPILIMSEADGESLHDLVDRQGPLPLASSLSIFKQICDAMSYAHQQGVLHRDLKPSNIQICDSQSNSIDVKVLDFGVAKVSSIDDASITRSGVIIGSPAFISPEQAADELSDERSDVYSMGCLMFHSLTGTPPFVGKGVVDTVYQQINKTAPLLNEVSDRLAYPEELEEIVAKALDKDPDQRFQSMEELRFALEELEIVNDTFSPETSYSPHSLSFNPPVKKFSTHSLVFGAVLSILTILVYGLFMVQNLDAPLESSAGTEEVVNRDFQIRTKNNKKWLVLGKEPKKGTLAGLAEYRDARRVSLKGYKVSSSHLRELNKLSLFALDLRDCGITDEAVEELTRIPSLEVLLLENNRLVTDRSATHLKELKSLRILNLEATGITDDAIPQLAKLEGLTLLYVSRCPGVTDRSLPVLKSMQSLKSLHVGDTTMTRSSASELLRQRNLTFVGLSKLKLTDGDIPDDMNPRFTMLDLSYNHISDATINRLSQLNPLWYLDVRGCRQVTIRSLKRFADNGELSVVRWDMSSNAFPEDFTDTEWYFEPQIYSEKLYERRNLVKTFLNWQGLDKIY